MDEISPLNPDEKSKVREYLATHTVLIVDDLAGMRASIAAALADMGSVQQGLVLASGYAEALEAIQARKPAVLISEYEISNRVSFGLLPEFRRSAPQPDSAVFVLVTGNSAESTVAAAAEEEVDTFIVKPFNRDMLQTYIGRAVMGKLKPSGYKVRLQDALQLHKEGKAEEALQVLVQSKELHERPAMACYYQGQVLEDLKRVAQSETSYREGISLIPQHYRCTLGLFDLYQKGNRQPEAYQVIRGLIGNFPLSPARLAEAIELAVKTGNFNDLSVFYDRFVALEGNREELRRYVTAALVVGGHYKVTQKEVALGMDLLRKGAHVSQSNPRALLDIVNILVDQGLRSEAQEFLGRFTPEMCLTAEYVMADLKFVEVFAEINTPLTKARAALQQGFDTPEIRGVLIRSLRRAGFLDEAENQVSLATAKWPNHSALFIGKP